MEHRAPKEMTQIQRLGRSPTLVTSDGRAIIESSAIATYLLKTYDSSGRFASADWIRDEELTGFAGASIGGLNTLELTLEIVAMRTPWPFSYAMRAARRGFNKAFTGAEFKKSLEFLEGELGEGQWFNGGSLGRCDVMLQWPIDLIATRGWVDFAKEYPKLDAWRTRILSSPAWKRALEKGNEYDLTVFG